MLGFLLGFTFWGVAYIKGRHLKDGGTFSDLSVNAATLIWGQSLFEYQGLLEETRQASLSFLWLNFTNSNFFNDDKDRYNFFAKLFHIYQ